MKKPASSPVPICTGEPYKGVVKLTLAKGASLKDPARHGSGKAGLPKKG